MKSEYFYCICSNLYIIFENINSIFRSFWIHIFCRTKFFDRTHHTKTFYSTEFSFFDLNSAFYSLSRLVTSCNASSIKNYRYLCTFKYIMGTCYNLNLLCSYIYLADYQFICIWMLFNLINLTYNNLIQICI